MTSTATRQGDEGAPEPTAETITRDTVSHLAAANRALRAENRALRATVAHLQAMSGELLEILDTDAPAPDTKATI